MLRGFYVRENQCPKKLVSNIIDESENCQGIAYWRNSPPCVMLPSWFISGQKSVDVASWRLAPGLQRCACVCTQ
eukprot:4911555-Ditylum_brightwellii.AAC.1